MHPLWLGKSYAFDEDGEVVLVLQPKSTPSFGNLPKIEVGQPNEDLMTRPRGDNPNNPNNNPNNPSDNPMITPYTSVHVWCPLIYVLIIFSCSLSLCIYIGRGIAAPSNRRNTRKNEKKNSKLEELKYYEVDTTPALAEAMQLSHGISLSLSLSLSHLSLTSLMPLLGVLGLLRVTIIHMCILISVILS